MSFKQHWSLAVVCDGRSRQEPKAACVPAAIDHWRQMQDECPISLAVLHAWLVSEHGYSRQPALDPALLVPHLSGSSGAGSARLEALPGAQAQVDSAHFPGVGHEG